MRLLEAILEANRRYVGGDTAALIDRPALAASLPVAALTCIDVRLNPRLPHALGLADEDFIWLRNAGNIITGPMSSTLRSLALACAVKGGKEIAIIGHSDCQVCKTTILSLTDALKAMGVDRARLPENLTEYFGLFASERQNVTKAVEWVRQSPLIGTAVPVHGLLLELPSGRLDWVVNGYERSPAVGSEIKLEARLGGRELFETTLRLPEFNLGEMKFPEFKIGQIEVQLGTHPAAEAIGSEAGAPAEAAGASIGDAATAPATTAGSPAEAAPPADWKAEVARLIGHAVYYKVIGSDLKQYGPISGTKLLEWILDDRLDIQTPIQIEGSAIWQPLEALIKSVKARHIPLPPPLTPDLRSGKGVLRRKR